MSDVASDYDDDGFYDDENEDEESISFDEESEEEYGDMDEIRDINNDICYSFPKKHTNIGTDSHRMKYVYESMENIDSLLQEKVTDLDMKLQIGEDKCTLLLLKYDWNENRLLEDFLSFSPAELQDKVGIKIHEGETGSKVPLLQPAKSGYMCMICCSEADDHVNDKSVSDPNDYLHTFHTSLCSHLYCTDCYSHYIQEKSLDQIVLIECPEPDCNYVLTPSEIKVLSDFNEGKINREEARLRELKEAKDRETNSKRLTEAEIEEKCGGFKDDSDEEDGNLSSGDLRGESENDYEVAQLFKFDERERERARTEQEDILKKSIYLRYKRNILLLYTKKNLKKMRYCPIPDCDNLVKFIGFDSDQIVSLEEFIQRLYIPSVECKSRHKFCFHCSEEDHTPCPCKLVAQWKIKCRDDSETAEWINKNTKDCPKCNNAIEKNGGCNHMTCRQCRHEFCWICMEKWKIHGTSYYNCTTSLTAEQKEDLKKRGGGANDAESFRRYILYVGLYDNQLISLKKDRKFCENLEMKVQRIQQKNNVSWIEAQFYRNCIDILLQCRLALVWSYATLYYIKHSHTKELMEKKTNLLSGGIERLSKLFEVTPIEDVMSNKKKFLDAADSVNNLRLQLNETYLDSLLDNVLFVEQPTQVNKKK